MALENFRKSLASYGQERKTYSRTCKIDNFLLAYLSEIHTIRKQKFYYITFKKWLKSTQKKSIQ